MTLFNQNSIVGLPSPTVDEKTYLSFLLRVWRVRQNEHFVWRASLEDTRTGERRGFANLEELVKFLRVQIREKDTKQTDSRTQK
jgi:hypothetical protein